ncbi:site-specific integrase [soil metagenome]
MPRADVDSDMAKRQNLTPDSIDALKSGRVADPQTQGLWIVTRANGRKVWTYRRRVVGSGIPVKMTLGHYPQHNIAAAREWAALLNSMVEAGVNPRSVEQDANDRASMTVAVAHGLYMEAVREGRGSRAQRLNKPRTIADKIRIYNCDIAPKLGTKVIYDIVEADLTKLILAKGKRARVRANRLAAELKVFFGWASSLRGTEIGLTSNPAVRLTDLKFAETPRTRRLSLEEIGWFLRAVALESRKYQRGMILWLLTAARLTEVIYARSDERHHDVWAIPETRAKNARTHRIALGPWGQSLFQTNTEWLFPSPRVDGPQAPSGWYKARNRVLARMSEYAGGPIERWTPHDMRRTARSNTKRLNVDFETAEAMLNHAKKGLERVYDGYELEDEKRQWFLKWEAEIIRIATAVGVADALGVPKEDAEHSACSPSPHWPARRIFTRGPAFPSRRAHRRT